MNILIAEGTIYPYIKEIEGSGVVSHIFERVSRRLRPIEEILYIDRIGQVNIEGFNKRAGY